MADNVKTTVMLPRKLRDRVKAMAATLGVSLSALVARGLEMVIKEK
jgi:hypothetical protein